MTSGIIFGRVKGNVRRKWYILAGPPGNMPRSKNPLSDLSWSGMSYVLLKSGFFM
jgi:hypothetical protein